MKKILLYPIIGSLLAFIACDPIADRDTLGDIVPASDFNYSITQDPENDYIIYLENNTPEVMFSWDYAWGTSINQKDTVHLLVPGNYSIEISAATAGGIVKTNYELTVNQSDPSAFKEPQWQMLTNFAEGKTWVLKSETDYGLGGFQQSTSPDWWNQFDVASDINDEMTFDLNGGRHMTLVEKGSGTPVTTEGIFDMNFSSVVEGWSIGELKTSNVTVIHGIDSNSGNAKFYNYYILGMTDNELRIAAEGGNSGEGWFWTFVPKQ